MRIPDGMKMQHRYERYEGVVDGLTEIVTGSRRNLDGRTQYRLKTGLHRRQLVTENDLCILLDDCDLAIMKHAKAPHHRSITEHLRSVFVEDRYVRRSSCSLSIQHAPVPKGAA